MSKRGVGALAVCALLGAGGRRDDLDVYLESPHYRLSSNATKEQAKHLLDFMETVYQTYVVLLRPEKDVGGERFNVLLYKDYPAYIKSGAPKSSVAYYSTAKRSLVGFFDATTMFNNFAHEGMHQFTDLTCERFLDLPYWFVEGVAECIGNSGVKEGKLYMCIKAGNILRGRLPVIQEAVRHNKAYSWKDLFNLDRTRFMADAHLCYAQAWSICHYMICYPKTEDPLKQIPDGRYRKNFAVYYETLRKGGVSHQAAWDAAFPGLSIGALEQEWRRYILQMDPGRFLGFRGKEIDDAQAEKLRLGSNCSGVLVTDITRNGVGESCGLAKDDIIVGFEIHRLPRGFAMDRLKLWVQDMPLGKPSRLKVLRGGKEIELKPVWEEPLTDRSTR